MGATEHIYYFEKPTIGICEKCDCFAIYLEGEGLICPKCKTKELLIFEQVIE